MNSSLLLLKDRKLQELPDQAISAPVRAVHQGTSGRYQG
ncbi:MAG: hypothetical protein MjAS7_1963 [Metallosphaera javensis (ex Sakai et al. 2022)]|nr:MAG: hypothetical protein MjAS7_1963 [Metallosphaera javensis (ex Sakai et al. 2022)]